MKEFAVYINYDSETKRKNYETLLINDLQVKFNPLENYQWKKVPGMLQIFETFLGLWESHSYQSLLVPRGIIEFIPTECLIDKFGKQIPARKGEDFIKALENSSKAALMVWTVGDAIKKEIMRLCTNGEHLLGLLLDMAVSLLLNEMHLCLQGVIRDKAESQFGLNRLIDYYPVINEYCLELTLSIFRSLHIGEAFGITFNDRMVYPEKSGFSIGLFGEKDMEFKNIACLYCHGKNCLYYQLGGCHVSDK